MSVKQDDSVMFIPITPGSVLKKSIQDRLTVGILRIKLVEYNGPKISQIMNALEDGQRQ